MSNDIEIRSLELVCDLRQQLGDALNSLAGKQSNGLLDYFLGYSAVHINRAADGYICLRKAAMVDASKLLIRPAIEAMIRILAVRKQPDLLYRIAYTERRQDRKLVRPLAAKAGMDYDTEDEHEWCDFKQKYAAHFPSHNLVETKLSLRDAATAAGIEGYYDSPYRLYCKYTHAAFGAAAGSLNTDSLDSRTMAHCGCCGLEAVASIGGDAPDLIGLRARLFSLDESGSASRGV